MSIGTAMKTMPLKDYLRLRGPAGGLFLERGEEVADRIEALEAALRFGAERCHDAARLMRSDPKQFSADFIELTGHRLHYVLAGGTFGADISEVLKHAEQTQGLGG